MARSDIISVPAGQWVELTAGDVTNISLYHRGGGEILLSGSTSSTAPARSEAENGVPLKREHFGFVNEALTSLFPEIAAVRVFAWTNQGPARVLVKHA